MYIYYVPDDESPYKNYFIYRTTPRILPAFFAPMKTKTEGL